MAKFFAFFGQHSQANVSSSFELSGFHIAVCFIELLNASFVQLGPSPDSERFDLGVKAGAAAWGASQGVRETPSEET